jgi:ABC-type uncharacterized transport system YnjBCD ATPase subunit
MTRALILALVLIIAPLSMAKADNDVGCGVGTEIWKGKTGVGYKIMASWTNGILFQSISVTFGLLNCNGQDTVTASARARHFAANNIDAIARDSAVGGGETLDALAALLEVDPTDRATFASLTQANFEELFPSDRTTSEEMLRALDRLMREDEILSGYKRS